VEGSDLAISEGRRLVTLLGTFAIGSALFSAKTASADPVSSLFPSGDFMISATSCPDSISFSDCTGTVDGGYWLLNSDASVNKVSYGMESPDRGTWSEVQPNQIFVEFYNEEGYWLSSVLADLGQRWLRWRIPVLRGLRRRFGYRRSVGSTLSRAIERANHWALHEARWLITRPCFRLQFPPWA
jgi:hypothetical protein